MTARLPALLLAVSFGTACAATPPPTADIYKSLARRQCEAGGETLDTLRAELQRAGVEPTAASCGTDGMMRAAMCGVGTGDIGIFTVRRDEVARAAEAGFRPLTDLRDAERTPCPGDTPKQTKR